MSAKVLFYSLYERIWHWIQAVSVVVLLASGFAITFVDGLIPLGFETSVHLHHVVGIVLVVNAALALFYNVTGGVLQRYIPALEEIFPLGFKHAGYYLFGIFKGEAHPFDKTPDKRLLPLQKVTYFIVLNLLLPLMMVTGLLKLGVDVVPGWVALSGGLKVLGPLHRLGAWLFAAFLILHVYMTTTGTTIWSNLAAMITGYEHSKTCDQEDRGA